MEVRMKQIEGTLKTPQGMPELFLRAWEPEKTVRAVMVLIHGLGEHSGRYGGDFASFYTKSGLAILAPDLPGHGQTKGKRGHIAQTAMFLDYLDLLVGEANRRYPGKPLFIYGHSMGGLITLWYTLDRHPQTAGVIVTSPAIAIHDPVPGPKKVMAQIMDKLMPAFSMENGLAANLLSRDPQVVQAYKDDPLVHSRISARLGLMMIGQGQWIFAHAPENQNNLLAMIGSEEGIVSKDAVDQFCKIAPRVTYKVWPNLFHEIHNEAEKQEVFDFTLDWIDKAMA